MDATTATPGSSVRDVLRELPDAPIATSRDRFDTGITLDFHAASSQYQADVPARDHHLLLYTPYGTGRMLQRRDGRSFESVIGPGSVILMPAGLPSLWDGTATATARMRIDPTIMARAADEIGGRPQRAVELLNVFQMLDPVIEHLALILTQELDMPAHPAQALLVSSVSCALAAHLLRTYDAFGVNPGRAAAPSGLPPAKLAAVIAMMHDRTAERITVGDLAAVAGISRWHFSRLFRLATGMSPALYLERVRIQVAEGLLRNGHMPVAEVALACGFADQSHFTRRFKRHTGSTPAAYASGLRYSRPR